MCEEVGIRTTLVRAGEIAMGHFRRVAPRWKESQSYVTEADLAVQSFLVAWLKAHYPGDGIIAEEEQCRVAPQGSSRYWTVDPIDGTASFVAGLPVWGIGLGLVEAGVPLAGYYYIPMTGDYYCYALGGRVLRNGELAPIKAPAPLHRESLLLSTSGLHRQAALSSAYRGKVRSLGSTIGHMCFVATGSADAALLGRVWLWDLLPGWALLQAAGGILKFLHGPMVDLTDLYDGTQARRLMLCGHPDSVRRYEEVLSHKHPPIGSR